ncbi:MAG: DUF971 domain-containing protein [Gammaproteobacteria bacterium]|nr:MAG: DUF971 domain-containing protein [Gammaproteobacteria bacterium]
MEEGAPPPTELRLHRRSRTLEVAFGPGERYRLPCELLRVYSPSAEVQGHGPGEGVLVVGKEGVGVEAIEPVGRYGVRLRFDDGHATGIYTWAYLRRLGRERERLWARYLERLAAAGYRRREPEGGA